MNSFKEAVAPPSFYEHMMAQIRERFPNEPEKSEAIALLHMLDDRGFLPNPPDSPVLSILKTFHPPGIFAEAGEARRRSRDRCAERESGRPPHLAGHEATARQPVGKPD